MIEYTMKVKQRDNLVSTLFIRWVKTKNKQCIRD